MSRPAPTPKRIGVLIIDDDPFVRQALAQFVNTAPDLAVLGCAPDGSDAIQLVGRLKPQVVLMDVHMPEVDGMDATRAIRVAHPDVRVLVLTAFGDHETVDTALRAGASGFLHKTAKPQEVVNAIRLVARGHGVLPAEELNRRWTAASKQEEPIDFTQREREVLTALGRGLANRDIAAELSISESTVKMHLSSLMAKLGASSRIQVLVHAHHRGLA